MQLMGNGDNEEGNALTYIGYSYQTHKAKIA